jgi:vomeronasal 2 receptor
LADAFIWLSGHNDYIPNYTCGREKKSAAVLTGTSGTSALIASLIDLYKFPQVRVGGMEKCETMSNLL